MLLRCYYAFILPLLKYCSPVWGQLLNVTFSFSSARCIRCPDFALIRVSCRCVIYVMLLDCACCTRLIQTRITVSSVSFHLLLPEFDKLVLRPQLIHWSLKYHGEEHPNLQDISCRPWFEYGMTFLTLRLTPERWIGLWVQLTVG